MGGRGRRAERERGPRATAVALVGLGVLAVLATPSLSGCAAFTNSAPARGGPPVVVAAFYPLQFVSERIAGDHATVVGLTRPGAEPHDLELSIAQTAQVADASLVVYERGLQPPVDDAVDQDADGAVVDASSIAGLEPFTHGGHDHVDDSGLGALGGDETGSDGLGDLDPHFWQDPLKLARVADAVARALERVDPAHATAYRANAARLDGQLRTLDRQYAAGLTDCERHTIVVSHNAFGYLARYGIDVEPISGLSPDAEPTPADLARLQQLIRRDGITTVFSERLVSAKDAETLARDTGVRSAVLDPVEGLTDQTSEQDYLSLMRANLAALRSANGCR